MLRSLVVALVALLSLWSATATAALPTQTSPAELATRIQARAARHSFHELRAYGDAAAGQPGRDGLRRLHLVVTIFRS